MSSPSAQVVRVSPASIFSPIIDFLCVGGLSLLVLVPLLLSRRDELDFVSLGALAWAQILINMSHFMASYRIVYRDRQMIQRHKWAAIWVPLILLLYVLLAIGQAQHGSPLLVGLLVFISSGYLAWHYTGQVWGMMASYAYLDGIRFEPGERRLIRSGLRILLFWHLIWAVRIWLAHTALQQPFWIEPLYQAASAAMLLALLLGVLGLWQVRRRAGRFPPARALVAWIAIFVWYLAMARWGLPGLFLVQLAHAIQYLEFPARVELNRAAKSSASRTVRHMALYAAAVLAVSFLVTLAVPGPAMSSVAGFLDDQPRSVAPVLILAFINIHHYFTDGVIWKISNPEVRRELFAHLRPGPPAATPATGPGPGGPFSSRRR